MLLKFLVLLVLAACLLQVEAGTRIIRSPQFGSASQASAKASAGGFGQPGQFGPGFGRPGFGRPGFGGPAIGKPRFSGPGFGGPSFGARPGSGTNISISKSVSISTGNGGVARSNAQSASSG
ncbi:PREDICTED: gastrolith matrix protein-like [Papilio polytes]|uniref:gastrolith matrix protein-like n=1 Tax=Papilio polytes TaxID=76194 RepID=UPI0006765914|nr:PREDICTED: gastrolith matrix protein-like [Papilio polytes]